MRNLKSLKIERKVLFIFEDKKPIRSGFGTTTGMETDTTTTTITLTSTPTTSGMFLPGNKR